MKEIFNCSWQDVLNSAVTKIQKRNIEPTKSLSEKIIDKALAITARKLFNTCIEKDTTFPVLFFMHMFYVKTYASMKSKNPILWWKKKMLTARWRIAAIVLNYWRIYPTRWISFVLYWSNNRVVRYNFSTLNLSLK